MIHDPRCPSRSPHSQCWADRGHDGEHFAYLSIDTDKHTWTDKHTAAPAIAPHSPAATAPPAHNLWAAMLKTVLPFTR